MRAFYIKTNATPPLFLGNDEAIFIFTNRESAVHRLVETDAEPMEKMWIQEIRVEEVQ